MSHANPSKGTTNEDAELDRLFIDLENSFMSFLREDPTRTTPVPATLAAQHFEQRFNAWLTHYIARKTVEARIDELERAIRMAVIDYRNTDIRLPELTRELHKLDGEQEK